MTYQFNPLDFGYEPAENFPELKGIVSKKSFVKVTTISESKAPTYWYSVCSRMDWGGDERWCFNASSWQEGSHNDIGRQVYLGTITTKSFAKTLLSHLMGTCKNRGVEDWGVKRLKRNINAKRLDSIVIH